MFSNMYIQEGVGTPREVHKYQQQADKATMNMDMSNVISRVEGLELLDHALSDLQSACHTLDYMVEDEDLDIPFDIVQMAGDMINAANYLEEIKDDDEFDACEMKSQLTEIDECSCDIEDLLIEKKDQISESMRDEISCALSEVYDAINESENLVDAIEKENTPF